MSSHSKDSIAYLYGRRGGKTAALRAALDTRGANLVDSAHPENGRRKMVFVDAVDQMFRQWARNVMAQEDALFMAMGRAACHIDDILEYGYYPPELRVSEGL